MWHSTCLQSLRAIACYYSNGYLGETHRKGIAWQQRWEELRRDNVEKLMCTRGAEKNILVTSEIDIYKIAFKSMTAYSVAFSDVLYSIYPMETGWAFGFCWIFLCILNESIENSKVNNFKFHWIICSNKHSNSSILEEPAVHKSTFHSWTMNT